MSTPAISEKTVSATWLNIWDRHGSAIVTTLCLLFIVLAWFSGKYGNPSLEIPFYLLAYIIGGYQKAWEGLQTLIKERELDVDLLMVVAAVGAASIGFWLDGAILIFIFSLSGTLETYTMERTNKDIRSIMKLRPEEALVLRGTTERLVKIEALQKGDLVVVKPGERIPADGIVQKGYSAVDQSSITGESLPVDRSQGDEVYAGTINGQGALVIEVTKPAEATLLARIIRLVQEAQSEMPPTQLFVERFERMYAKVVVVGAVVLMVTPPFLLDWTWSETIYRAMIFLVAASPCALVSSIMPAVLSGISNGARKGILFKGGVHLEKMAGIKVVAFDKTGTLTEGKPKVTDIISFQGNNEDELLRITASLEALSEHPIAKAIVGTAKDRGLQLDQASHLQALPGLGITAMLNNQEYRIGKIDLLNYGFLSEDRQKLVQTLEQQGKTIIFIETGVELLGILAIQDTLRPQSRTTVETLKQMGIKVVMLTGDSASTAKVIGEATGVDEIYAELLPEQKMQIVKNLTEQYGKVAMVGDGVNDAPALAAASMGIAMGGSGTDVALETASIVLMSDDISKVPYAITLGRRTSRVIKQNLTLAIAMIVVLVTANFLGTVNLPLGVIGHEGSTLAVIISGLRLLR
ncbi:heavy metal translocating P-type ATPase [Effusibacillus consociatus]|uniref:Heavy metal translocating P-type ATPase n=1 Tax=Effusibacillus consociatus TaxID=1117041 RepID=A0ABV9Q6H6_9BACL